MVPMTGKPPGRLADDLVPAATPGDGALLIVTMFPERFALLAATADIVGSTGRGLELCEQRRYAAIFCDVGPLAGQESGFRFASALKKRGSKVPLYLMAETVTAHDRMWAKRNGASDLIPRHHLALSAVVGRSPPAAAAATTAAASTAPPTPERIERMKLTLRKYIGPVADELVRQTQASLSRRLDAKVPAEALAQALAQYIEDERLRDRFLAEVGH